MQKTLPQNSRKKSLCYCNTDVDHDCYKELLDPVYPGQTLTLPIYINNNIVQGFEIFDTVVTVANDIELLNSPTACLITNSSQLIQIAKSYTCNILKSISSQNEKLCEIFLKR